MSEQEGVGEEREKELIKHFSVYSSAIIKPKFSAAKLKERDAKRMIFNNGWNRPRSKEIYHNQLE